MNFTIPFTIPQTVDGFDLTTVVYSVICATTFVLTFCRLNKLNKETLLRVRLAYWSLGVMLAMSLIASWVDGAFGYASWQRHDPNWMEVGLVLGLCFVQAATSRAWKHGTPKGYETQPSPLETTAAAAAEPEKAS